MQVQVVENVLKLNDEIAQLNRERFAQAGVFAIDLIGAPGSGKTTLLEETLRQLGTRINIGVVVGDLATTRDAQRIVGAGAAAVQINTGKGCHLDANQVRQAIQQLDLDHLDLLIIENVGNLICPVGFDLGQHAKVGLFSIAEGDDKAAKHPHLVRAASLLLLNKTDLLPYVSFNPETFCTDVAQLNPDVPLLEISAARHDINPWTAWLQAQLPVTANTLQAQG